MVKIVNYSFETCCLWWGSMTFFILTFLNRTYFRPVKKLTLWVILTWPNLTYPPLPVQVIFDIWIEVLNSRKLTSKCTPLVNLIKKHFTIVMYRLKNCPYYGPKVIIYARKMFIRLATIVLNDSGSQKNSHSVTRCWNKR